MKRFTVKLTLLSKQPSIAWDEYIPVFLNSNFNTPIGTCRVIHNKVNGELFGEVTLEQQVSGDLFFYYESTVSTSVSFYFSGLNFTENQLRNKPTTQLSDMIVE